MTKQTTASLRKRITRAIDVPAGLPPGHYTAQLEQIDFSKLEFRVLAALSKEERYHLLYGGSSASFCDCVQRMAAVCPWDDWKPGRDVA